MADFTIALAGNPNAGKSTIFNALTGLRQHTGNWPGKTVEKKSGSRLFNDQLIDFIDLPGTYSLSAFSPDEIIARDFIIHDHPDAVICVVDATNLERNLYLLVQLLEFGVSLIVALNMSDQTRALGLKVDIETLSRLLGNAPTVPTSASKGDGIDTLLSVSATYLAEQNGQGERSCRCRTPENFQVDYGSDIEAAILRIESAIEMNKVPLNGACSRWMALKLLEGESDIVAGLAKETGGAAASATAAAEAELLAAKFGEEVDMITADQRYKAISAICKMVINRAGNIGSTLSERIDKLVTHRVIGLPIFLAIMYIIFRLVIDVSAPFLDWVDNVINGPLATAVSSILISLGSPEWLHSLVVEGIIAGVGGILTFVPGLIVLFFFLALLEDSGYLARAAFIMDRFMRLIGLHGKSVIPLMLGFGCAVPAVYATRTIANRRNRLLTALLIPFMSCSARLPVYVVFAMAFFGSRASTIIWLMYLFGVIVAILVGFVLSKTVLKPTHDSTFVLELPPYRLPTTKGLFLHTWENTKEFIRHAGTVILAVSVILWFLLNIPWGVQNQQDSLFGQMSELTAPILEPAGFGNWESSGALITGLIAKELVVTSLAQIYVEPGEQSSGDHISGEQPVSDSLIEGLTSIGAGFLGASLEAGKTIVSLIPGINLETTSDVDEDTTLIQAIRNRFTPLAAFAFLFFVLLYIPCIATMGAIRQEFGGRWALSAAFYQTFIAWLIAVLIFQGGQIAGLG